MKITNSKGFSAIEALLILVIVGILAGAGWFVYNSQKKTNKSLDSAANTSTVTANKKKPANKSEADVYEGWQTYTTMYEKMSFKYPTDLTLTDTSIASTPQDGVTPGSDRIKLTGTGGFTVSIQTGLDGIGGGCPECTIDFSDPVTIAGTSYKINYVNNGSGKISSVTASKITNDFIGAIDGKTIVIRGTTNKAATIISASFRSGNNILEKPLAEYKAEHFVAEFKLLLESISY